MSETKQFIVVAMLCLILCLFAVSMIYAQEAPIVPPPEDDSHPNRFSLLCGYGPDGLNYTQGANGQNISVAPYFGALVGVGYSRLVWERASVSGLAMVGTSKQSKTFVGALGLGWDW